MQLSMDDPYDAEENAPLSAQAALPMAPGGEGSNPLAMVPPQSAAAPAAGGLDALGPLPPAPSHPDAPWDAFNAEVLRPVRGGFGEALANAYGAYNAQRNKDAELNARYAPLAEAAAMRREVLRQQQLQARLAAQAKQGANMANVMGALLQRGAAPTYEAALQAVQLAQRQGLITPQFAQQYISGLPQDPETLAAYVEQSARAAGVKPISIKEGEQLWDPLTGRTLATGASKPTDLQRLLNEREALPPGDPRRAAYDDAIRTATTHRPANNINLNTAKPLLTSLLGDIGKALGDSRTVAQGSLSTINTTNDILEALNSGRVIAGPATSPRVLWLQLGEILGATGKNDQERLLNTRQVIRGLAQLELKGAEAMRGQGQITENERDLIKRASSGEIDKLTVPELRDLVTAMQKIARTKIRQHNSQIERLRHMQGANAGQLETLMPLLNVEEPPEPAAPTVPTPKVVTPPGGGQLTLPPDVEAIVNRNLKK